jgi:hypothetical protein
MTGTVYVSPAVKALARKYIPPASQTLHESGLVDHGLCVCILCLSSNGNTVLPLQGRVDMLLRFGKGDSLQSREESHGLFMQCKICNFISFAV